MIKLYTSANHPQSWIAYAPGSGWLIFPARQNGWEQRRPVRGLDPVHLRQVPGKMAANAGMPEFVPVPGHLQAA